MLNEFCDEGAQSPNRTTKLINMFARRTLLLAISAASVCACFSSQLKAEIWINEFHYNNIGADQNEFVEIVIVEGTNATGPDLGSIRIDLYDQATGASYDGIFLDDPSIILTSDANADYYVWHPTEIQDGAGDAIALSLGIFTTQFFSYGGGVTVATSGIAEGITSTDVGFGESESTPLNSSIGLAGNGEEFDDFFWNAPTPQTDGGLNFGQSFGAVPEPSSAIIIAVLGAAVALRRKRSTHC